MPVTNVRSEWVDGNLIFRSADGTEIARFDGTSDVLIVPGGTRSVRARFATSEVNSGAVILPAIPGFRYRVQDMAMIAVGGNAATADSVDILGTRTSGVKLMAGLVAGLTRSTLLRAGTATNGVILADGASFTAVDANTPITIGKTGSNLATATHVDVLITYVLEAA